MIKSGVAHLEMKGNNADLVILMIYVNKKYICVASVKFTDLQYNEDMPHLHNIISVIE